MENEEYPDIRNLDDYLVRVFRNNKWIALSYTDLTKAEQMEFLESCTEAILKALVKNLSKSLRTLGDELEVYRSKKSQKDSELDFF